MSVSPRVALCVRLFVLRAIRKALRLALWFLEAHLLELKGNGGGDGAGKNEVGGWLRDRESLRVDVSL